MEAQDYKKIIKSLRYCGNFMEREGCDESCEYFNDMDCPNRIMSDAAAAIEALQAKVKDAINEGYNAGYTAGIGYCSFKRAKKEVQE